MCQSVCAFLKRVETELAGDGRGVTDTQRTTNQPGWQVWVHTAPPAVPCARRRPREPMESLGGTGSHAERARAALETGPDGAGTATAWQPSGGETRGPHQPHGAQGMLWWECVLRQAWPARAALTPRAASLGPSRGGRDHGGHFTRTRQRAPRPEQPPSRGQRGKETLSPRRVSKGTHAECSLPGKSGGHWLAAEVGRRQVRVPDPDPRPT